MNTIPYPRFYLLDYFYVLLKGIEKYSKKEEAFSVFINLKDEYRLGESKYRKLTLEKKDLSRARENRYHDTFLRVIEEAKELEMIEENKDGALTLQDKGRMILRLYESKKSLDYNEALFQLIERKHNVFRTLIEYLFEINSHRPGMLVFPSYSPLQLGLKRSNLKTTGDIIAYSETLIQKFDEDFKHHLSRGVSLSVFAGKLIANLQDDGFLDKRIDSPFPPKKYNVIVNRFHDYWISIFLKEIYGFEISWSTFERWIYRGKQIGIIHATEFYPNFNGKIVYPTSVIARSAVGKDFRSLFSYLDGKQLFVHNPNWETYQNIFVKSLVESYFDLRHMNRYRGRFISLLALREVVCYKLKTSEFVFGHFLDQAYRLNLAGLLPIKISLEVDKLPEETKVRYLTREPVMVDGKYRNIVSIEVTKEDKS